MSRLRSRYVTVQVGQHGELPAVVESEDDREVVLSLAVQAPPSLGRVLERPVRIECISGRGIQHVTGPVKWSPEKPEWLCVIKESDETIQRREAVRVQAVVPTVVTVLAVPALVGGEEPAPAPPPGPISTTSLNVSSTGVLFRDPGELPLGTRVRLDLDIEPGQPPMVVTGTIVRAYNDEKGVHTEEISRLDQNRLGRYITEKQRAELRMRG